MVHQVLLLGAGFVTRPTAVELDKAGVKVTVGKQTLPGYHDDFQPHFISFHITSYHKHKTIH